MDLERIAEQVELQEQARAYRATHAREFAPDWYHWQRQHFEAGSSYLYRMVLAGNQTGKTLSGAYEVALHLTGDYPAWWAGKRFTGPITGWALGVDAQQLRDVIQQQLFGIIGADGKFTGGWVHPDEIDKFDRGQTPGLARDVYVRHRSGRLSHLSQRAYTQAQTGQSTLSFAGSKVDFVWVDEQPPDVIMGQLVARTTMGDHGRGGSMMYTMTPELGLTTLVAQFLQDRQPSQYLTGPVAWSECEHITPERAEQLLAAFPPHERDMRSKGVPLFGEGLVYPIAEQRLYTMPFAIQERPWAKRIRALDVGGNDHPTAVVWLSLDTETGITYLHRCYRQSGVEPAVHVAAANSQWPDTPVIVPPDIHHTEKGSMTPVIDYFKAAGLKRPIIFHNPGDRRNRQREPGIHALLTAMQEDRFKVIPGNGNEMFYEELRGYHRKNGQVVRQRDDILDAVRYGFQMLRAYGISDSVHKTPKVTGTARAFEPFNSGWV